jgi:hypothetical protein
MTRLRHALASDQRAGALDQAIGRTPGRGRRAAEACQRRAVAVVPEASGAGQRDCTLDRGRAPG